MKAKFVLPLAILFAVITIFWGCADEEGGVFLPFSFKNPPRALVFDGATDFLQASTTVLPTLGSDTSFTIIAWIRPNTTAPMGIFSLRDSSDGSYKTNISLNPSGQVVAVMGDTSTDAIYTSTATVVPNQTNFVAVVCDYDVVDIYINSGTTSEQPTNAGGTSYNNWGVSTIVSAGVDSTSSNYFSGEIHSIAYWDWALDVTNIEEVYNNGETGFNLKMNTANYTESMSLRNWWRLGEDPINLGKDIGNDPVILNSPTLTTDDATIYL